MSGNQQPVNVLYCESNSDGTIGGSHYCLLHLIENLDRSRYVPIVTFCEEHALLPRFQAVAELIIVTKHNPIRWGDRAGSGPRSWVDRPAALARKIVNGVRAFRKVAGHTRFLRRRRIGLVHLNNSVTRHHDWMVAAFIARVPCITHERGLPDYRPVDRAFGRRLELIIPVSRWVRDAMVSRGVAPDNVRVMYDGLDPAPIKALRPASALREAWDVRPEQPVIGIVGNIRAWKGQETVVRALIDVVRSRPDVVCFFVGAASDTDRSFESGLHRMIDDAGIGQNVRFTGYQREVPSFINMMNFVVHASVLPEPFGMVALEAMAQRKAVVGSRAGGIVEIVIDGQTGYTFPPGDAAALSARVCALLSDPALAERMGENGYARLLSTFSLQRYMNDLHAAYRAILDRRPVPSHLGIVVDSENG